MKEFDELGIPLCQAAYVGTQCQGHEGHYSGDVMPHFTTLNDGAVTWTDENEIVDKGTVDEVVFRQISRCRK
jgi:hypothetical protein